MLNLSKEEIDFLTRFVVESDAIEGIKNDSHEIRRQLETLPHFQPTHTGVMWLLNAAADNRHLLEERQVKMVQEFIVCNQHLKGQHRLEPRHVGEWRDCEIRIGARAGEAARFVPTHMRHLIEEARQWQHRRAQTDSVQERVRFIARWHWQYELVHPFADGNGRSGRALVYYLHRFACLKPFVFMAHDRREEYYPCFDQTSPERMEKYFLDRSPAIL